MIARSYGELGNRSKRGKPLTAWSRHFGSLRKNQKSDKERTFLKHFKLQTHWLFKIKLVVLEWELLEEFDANVWTALFHSWLISTLLIFLTMNSSINDKTSVKRETGNRLMICCDCFVWWLWFDGSCFKTHLASKKKRFCLEFAEQESRDINEIARTWM